MTIPVTVNTDLVTTIRRLRKRLRDIRDRAARAAPLSGWASLAVAGMVSGDHVVLLVQHAGIEQDALWTVLERRWPEIIVAEASPVTVIRAVHPRSDLSVEQTVQMAVLRRGVEPIRVVIPPQVRAGVPGSVGDEPMPMTV